MCHDFQWKIFSPLLPSVLSVEWKNTLMRNCVDSEAQRRQRVGSGAHAKSATKGNYFRLQRLIYILHFQIHSDKICLNIDENSSWIEIAFQGLGEIWRPQQISPVYLDLRIKESGETHAWFEHLALIFLLFLFSLLILFFLHFALILSTREVSARSMVLQDIPS